MTQTIQVKISQITALHQSYIQSQVKTQDQTKNLLIETLQTLTVLIHRFTGLINESTLHNYVDKVMIVEQSSELEEKCEKIRKLTKWFVAESGEVKNAKQRQIVLGQIDSILVSSRTILIRIKSKTDYANNMMLNNIANRKLAQKTINFKIVQFYRHYIAPLSQNLIISFIIYPFVLVVKLLAFCLVKKNTNSTSLNNDSEIQNYNSFENNNNRDDDKLSEQKTKSNLEQVSQAFEWIKQLTGIYDYVKNFVN